MKIGSDQNQETFVVHKQLLVDKSEYFRAAIDNDFAENSANEFCLPEDDPNAFCIFIDWLYEGFLHQRHKSEELVDVWILADKLMCPNLQDEALDLLKEAHKDLGITFATV